MNRPCYRHLDRRFELLFGLSHWDLLLSVGAAVVVMATVHPLAGIAAGVGIAIFLKCVKVGRPRGYLGHLAYRLGLLGLLPDGVRPPGLTPAPPIFGRRTSRYSAVPGEADDEGRTARHFWSGKAAR